MDLNIKKPSKQEIEKIFGKEASSFASEKEKEKAYCYLGVLATSFAQLESQIMALIATMEGLFLTGYALIENNSLEKNLQLLETINKFRNLKPKEVKDFIAAVRKLKNDRNSLIHGTWQIFRNETNRPIIAVSNNKTNISTENSQVWLKSTSQKIFSFEEMEVLIKTTKQLITQINELLVAQMCIKSPGSEKTFREMMKSKMDGQNQHL